MTVVSQLLFCADLALDLKDPEQVESLNAAIDASFRHSRAYDLTGIWAITDEYLIQYLEGSVHAVTNAFIEHGHKNFGGNTRILSGWSGRLRVFEKYYSAYIPRDTLEALGIVQPETGKRFAPVDMKPKAIVQLLSSVVASGSRVRDEPRYRSNHINESDEKTDKSDDPFGKS